MNNNLITSQMVEVAETFADAYNHVLENMVGDQRNQIVGFVANLVYSHKPYILVSPEGLPMAQGMVFGSDLVRDFILTLNFAFFARWGHSDEAVIGLAQNLARGLGTPQFQSITAMPVDIHNRLSAQESVSQLLQANPWLMILLMLPLFIHVEQPKPGK